TRVVGLLGGIFTYAVERGLRDDNPCHGVRKFPDGKRDRRLSEQGYAALCEGLRAAWTGGGAWPPGRAGVRFLVLTVRRRGEAPALVWRNIDAERRTAILADTKTGRSVRPLAMAALETIGQPPERDDEPVFPSNRGDGPLDPKAAWRSIAKRCKLAADIT